MTLHLRAPDGTYAGPVVVGRERSGRRAILGVRAGARLGLIAVRRGKGYAKTRRKPARRAISAGIAARARKGIPIGAGRFGRVRSAITGAGAPGDPDFDGIPDPLDIDDNGNLVLDSAERPGGASAAQDGRDGFELFTGLPLQLEYTANANMPGSTDQQIEAALPSAGGLLMQILPGDSTELDCGASPGLSYCTTGGTGKVFQPGGASGGGLPFPDCCDPDSDGFGTMQPLAGGPGEPSMVLTHGATTAQIGTGDVLIQRVTVGGVESQFATALEFVFATVPALVSYSDTAGNGTSVPYPIAPGPAPAPGGPGTQGNAFPIAAGPTGEVVLTLTFWRPQRRPIPPETGGWIDIGGLTYGVVVNHVGAAPPGGTDVHRPCPQGSLSNTDSQLTPSPLAPVPGLLDLTPDTPTNQGNVLTYTLNLTQCLTALGAPLNSGDDLSVQFSARLSRPGAPDGALQSLWFRLQ